MAGEASATTLSRQFGDVTVADLSYHLTVLFEDCGLIEQVRLRPARGAVEYFYRLKARSDFPEVSLPAIVRDGLRAELLQAFIEATAAALQAGTFDDDEKATLVATPVTVDQQGVAEINSALSEAIERIEKAEIAARRRLSGAGEVAEEVSLLIGAAAFKADVPLCSG